MIKDYKIEVSYVEEKDGYTAKVIEIPECCVFEKTKEEALKKVGSALNKWIKKALKEKKEIPESMAERIAVTEPDIIRKELRSINNANLFLELDENNLRKKHHIIKYIIEETEEEIDLRLMLDRLHKLLQLLDGTVDYIFYRNDSCKKKKNIKSDKLKKFELTFEGISGGSTCFNFSTPYDEKMEFASDQEKVLDFLFQTLDELNYADNYKIHSIINERFNIDGTDIIPFYNKFYKSIGNRNNPVKLEWTNLKKVKHKTRILPERARELAFLFRETERKEEREIVKRGYIKILNLIKLKIGFIDEFDITKEKPSELHATFNSLIYSKVLNLPDRLCECKFKVEITLYQYTKDTKEKWELIEIEEVKQPEIFDVTRKRSRDMFDLHYKCPDMPELDCIVTQEFAAKVETFMEENRELMERLAK